MHLVVRFSVFLALILGAACCRSRSPESARSGNDTVKAAVSAPRAVPAIDEQDLNRLISERHGKVLFLSIWATWCVPCKEEFPDLIRLHHELGGQQVEIVGISADYEDEVESKIVPFLQKMNVPFQNYVASFKHQEDFINAVDSSWNGALPVSLIYDPQGGKTYFHLGKGTFEQFKREIEKTKGGL